MDYNLFENLYKYKETENKSQLENFLTELFVYVLKSLIFQKNEVIITLLNDKFHIPFTKNDFDNIEIDTQIRYDTSDDYHPQPDISIIINNGDLYLIESKVDSSLNQYDDIDQIQLYESVITDYKLKGVRTLTKYEICTKERKEYKFYNPEKHKIFWHDVFEVLQDEKYCLNDNILVQNFLNFLKGHNMGKHETLKYSKNGLDNFYSLYNFLYEVIQDFASKEGYTTVQFMGSEVYFGFAITYSKKNVIWIGCYKDDNEKIIVETFADVSKLIRKLGKNWEGDLTKKNYYENTIFAELNLNDIIKEDTFAKQKQIFDKWITDNNVAVILQKSWDVISTSK